MAGGRSRPGGADSESRNQAQARPGDPCTGRAAAGGGPPAGAGTRPGGAAWTTAAAVTPGGDSVSHGHGARPVTDSVSDDAIMMMTRAGAGAGARLRGAVAVTAAGPGDRPDRAAAATARRSRARLVTAHWQAQASGGVSGTGGA